MNKRFLITISEELYEIIREKAFKEHISMTKIIRDILGKELKDEK